MAEEYEIRYLQSPHLVEYYPRFDNCNQYIFDSTNDYLLSVVNELDLHNLHLRKTGLYEIAKSAWWKINKRTHKKFNSR